jgi:hypothetical protein
MAQYVPSKAFGVWHLIPKFLLLKASPAFASSGIVVTKASNVISSGIGGDGENNSMEIGKNRRCIEKDYGLSWDVQAELDGLVMKFMFEENTVGANSEALQCLRKGSDGGKTWGKCEDYEVYVRELVTLERSRYEGGAGQLKVRAYFAGNDSMIGKKGQEYVEECWGGKEGTGAFEDVLNFESTTFAELEHDSLLQSAAVLESVFHHSGGIPVDRLE